MKTVIVACGSGIATSTIMCSKVEEFLDNHNVDYDIIQCSIYEIENYENQADVIISSTQLERDYSIPSILGISLITCAGEEETLNELLDILNK